MNTRLREDDVRTLAISSGIPADVGQQTAEMLDEQRAKDVQVRGVTVEAMVDQGIEVVIGGMRAPNFGPVVMFDQGGVDVESLGDGSAEVAIDAIGGVRELTRSLNGRHD